MTTRVRHTTTGEIGTVVHIYKAYPFKGDVSVQTPSGPRIWLIGEYEEEPPNLCWWRNGHHKPPTNPAPLTKVAP